ncbi:MAG: hypothetical protein ACR2MS_06910 [Weeksellaceae bacterium]
MKNRYLKLQIIIYILTILSACNTPISPYEKEFNKYLKIELPNNYEIVDTIYSNTDLHGDTFTHFKLKFSDNEYDVIQKSFTKNGFSKVDNSFVKTQKPFEIYVTISNNELNYTRSLIK